MSYLIQLYHSTILVPYNVPVFRFQYPYFPGAHIGAALQPRCWPSITMHTMTKLWIPLVRRTDTGSRVIKLD